MNRVGWRAITLCLVLAIGVALACLLWPQAEAPNIEGAILPEPKPLPDFTLRDHHNQPVSAMDLRDRWYLISYGFTYCPDVCPTTLASLAKFQHLLNQQPRYNDLQIIFYTIDPARDSSEKLAQYVNWFDQHFIGLRADNPLQGERFEHSLGMRVVVEPSDDPAQYQVAHGLRLYLIDNHQRLRASFAPSRGRDGSQRYRADKLLSDYLALRRWFANESTGE